MPVILPFRAFRSHTPTLYIPGEEEPLSLYLHGQTQLQQPALFLYRQRFCLPDECQEYVREGVMGLLDRSEATIYPHEETFPDRVSACARTLQTAETDPGSLWLWSQPAQWSFDVPPAAFVEARDSVGCLHQLWPITDSSRIIALQSALAGKPLFLADGHHRFAAGWNLATIQIRSDALITLPAHRLVLHAGNLEFPKTRLESSFESYLAAASSRQARCVAVSQGPVFSGFELPPGLTPQRLLSDACAVTQPIRNASQAIAAVQKGQAPLALLVSPLSLCQIERNASRGILLPPKSTDFFPKLAAGLIMHRHQNENVTPMTAQRLGVRKPSS